MNTQIRRPLGKPIPAFHMVEIPFHEDGLEVIAPSGEVIATLPGKWCPRNGEGPWPDGSRLTSFTTSAKGNRIVLAQWTWRDGKRQMDPEQIPDERATIYPDFGADCCWDRYGCNTDIVLLLEGVAGAEALNQAFDQWQARWQVFSLDDLYDGAVPEGGWYAFEADGMEICKRLMNLMGPDGVVIYRTDFFSPLNKEGGLLLYWEADGEPRDQGTKTDE